MIKFVIKYSRLILLLLLGIYFSIQSPDFLTIDNLSNVSRVGAFLVILSLGQCIVIISGNGGIDLSNGSIAAISSCIAALIIAQGHVALGIIAGLIVGCIIGLINGSIISIVKLPPFVATYGIDFAIRGLAYIIMSGTIVYGVFSDSFRFIGAGRLFGLGVPIYIAVISTALLYFMMAKTTWGRNVYSIGCNKRAAEISGINVKRIQMSVYVLNGLISAFVGILYIARLNAAEPVLGTAFALQSIGAVVLGGVSLRGGKGSIINAVIGAVLITMINNGLTLMGVSSYWQSFVFGSVIIVAIIIEIGTSYLERRVSKDSI